MTPKGVQKLTELQKIQSRKKREEKVKNIVVNTEQVEKAKEAAPEAKLGAQTQVVKKEVQSKTLGLFDYKRQMEKQGTDQDKSSLKKVAETKSKTARQKPVERSQSLGRFGIAQNVEALPKEEKKSDTDEHTGVDNAKKDNRDPFVKGRENHASSWLDNVEMGDQTLLNTKEFVYYGFYRRIQEQFEPHWRELIQQKVEQIFVGGGRLPRGQDLETQVVIVLNEKGTLVDVSVVTSSGRLELDGAAVEAFRKANHFPNPPKGIVQNGVVKIECRFVLRT